MSIIFYFFFVLMSNKRTRFILLSMNEHTQTLLNTLKHKNEIIRNRTTTDNSRVQLHDCTEIMNTAIELLRKTHINNDNNTSSSNSRHVIETCICNFMSDTKTTMFRMDDAPFFICKTWVK